MAVTKTDWSQPSSAPVNNPGSSASAQRYQAQADAIQQAAIQQAAADMYMTQAQAQDPDPYQEPIQTIDRMQAAIDASKARDAERYALAAQQAVDLDRLRAAEQAAAIARGAADLGFGPSVAPATPVATPMTAAQIQAARGVSPIMQSYFPQRAGFDLYQDVLGDASAAARANIAAASPGLFGIPTRFMNEKFLTGLGSRMGGRDSDAYQKFLSDQNLFEPVYDQAGRLTGYRDQYGRLTGRDTLEASVTGGDDDEQVVPTVTNPATGREECPDGYTFDPDLNACRLDTRGGTTTAPDAPAAPGVPGAQYARMGLLDVAPEGLMGFQERYGAGFGTPSDFGAANLAFRQQGAISPEYYQTPPKLTGYTLLG